MTLSPLMHCASLNKRLVLRCTRDWSFGTYRYTQRVTTVRWPGWCRRICSPNGVRGPHEDHRSKPVTWPRLRGHACRLVLLSVRWTLCSVSSGAHPAYLCRVLLKRQTHQVLFIMPMLIDRPTYRKSFKVTEYICRYFKLRKDSYCFMLTVKNQLNRAVFYL